MEKKMHGDLAVPKKSRTFAVVFKNGLACFFVQAMGAFGTDNGYLFSTDTDASSAAA